MVVVVVVVVLLLLMPSEGALEEAVDSTSVRLEDADAFALEELGVRGACMLGERLCKVDVEFARLGSKRPAGLMKSCGCAAAAATGCCMLGKVR